MKLQSNREKLIYLLGAVRYFETGQEVVTDQSLFPLCRDLGAAKVAEGYSLRKFLQPSLTKFEFDFPEKFIEKLKFFEEDGAVLGMPVYKASDYFNYVKQKVNSGKFRGTMLADFLWAVWGVANLNYQMEFGRVALVKEKKIGEAILKKGKLEDILIAAIDYILSGKDPNIWFFNTDLAKFLQSKGSKEASKKPRNLSNKNKNLW